MPNTIDVLKKRKVDAVYGKKKHFNAADRKRNYHLCIGIPLIVLNVITGSVLIAVICNPDTWTKFIPLVLTVISGILASFQTFFNFSKAVEGHRRIGNRYLQVYKKCSLIENQHNSGLISDEILLEKIDEVSELLSQVDENAESFPTNKKDFDDARSGISDGEESYTEEELNL